MYGFIRNLNRNQGLFVEGPAFIVSLVIAELCYKFHSFTLECVGFMATWLVISAIASWATAPLLRACPAVPLRTE